MQIPADWAASRLPGYGAVYQLTHTECGWSSSRTLGVDILDDRQVRGVVYGHECEDKREAREARERHDNELAALKSASLAPTRARPGVAVLDFRDEDTLRASVAALHHADRARLTEVIGEFADEDATRAIVDTVRKVVSTDEDLEYREVVGVGFYARQEEDGYFLSSDDGTVLFDDGSTETFEFPGVARLFSYAGCVGPDYSLIVDCRRDGVVTTYDVDNYSIRYHLMGKGTS